MQKTSRDLIKRARSLADLPNTTFITYDDELNSLNEAYHKAYTKLTESDDDYFVTTIDLTIDAGTLELNNVYSADLPADFFALRLVAFNNNGTWQNMPKFSMSQFSNQFNWPMYRIQNGKLMVKMPIGMFLPDLTVQYYPAPQTIYKPKEALEYITGTLAVSTVTNASIYIDEPGEVDESDYLFYVKSNAIRMASIKQGSDIELKISGVPVIGKVWYFGGFLYWIQDTSIYRATCDFETLGTPAVFSGADVVTNFSISNNTLIYNNGAAIKAVNLITGAGNSSTGITAGTLEWITLPDGTFRWIEAGLINGTALAADYLYAYGDLILFASGFNLSELVVDEAELIRADAYLPQGSGEISGSYLATRGKYPVSAIGVDPDTVLEYPNNFFWEYVAYLCAVDFCVKQNKDAAQIIGLLQNVENTLKQSLVRDEFTVARINNSYGVGQGGVGQW